MTQLFTYSIYKRFLENSEKPAIHYRHCGKYHCIKYSELIKRIGEFAGGLKRLGAKRGDKLLILHENSAEWMIADLSSLFIGLIDVPLYKTVSREDLKYIIEQLSPEFVFVSDHKALKRIIASDYESLKEITFIINRRNGLNEKEEAQRFKILSYDEVIDFGKNEIAEERFNLEDEMNQSSPDDIATIIYTSGTTGMPKGVVISQKNIMAEIKALSSAIETEDGDSIISFLPLSHVLARLVDYFILYNGCAIYYPDKPEALSKNLIEIKPTLLVGVPRVFDKIFTTVMDECSGGIKKWLLDWALKQGSEYEDHKRRGNVSTVISLKKFIAERIVFSRIKMKLGGKLRTLISGGAPLSSNVANFFNSIGLPIQEGYGLTETCCAVTLNRRGREKIGTVGQPLEEVEIKISEDNEILIKGDMVMSGYFKDEKATSNAIDSDGWFHSGDAGYLDSENYLVITDRIKELIKTSSGKYVAPQKIEAMLTHHSAVSNAIVVGDRKKYITALVVPDRDFVKKNILFLKSIEDEEYRKVLNDEKVQDFFKKIIAEINSVLEPHEKIKNFRLLSNNFSVDSGELTPTFKLKRKYIIEKNKDLIDDMYKEI